LKSQLIKRDEKPIRKLWYNITSGGERGGEWMDGWMDAELCKLRKLKLPVESKKAEKRRFSSGGGGGGSLIYKWIDILPPTHRPSARTRDSLSLSLFTLETLPSCHKTGLLKVVCPDDSFHW
jgi:hypothetical protein